MGIAKRHAKGSKSLESLFARAGGSPRAEQDDGETTQAEESTADNTLSYSSVVAPAEGNETVSSPDYDADEPRVQGDSDSDPEGLGIHPGTGGSSKANLEEGEELESPSDPVEPCQEEALPTPKGPIARNAYMGDDLVEHPCFGRRGETDVWCGMCGQLAHKDRVQILNKCAGTWKCNKCNARCVQLHAKFGQWPPSEFKDMDKEEIHAFWSSLKDSKFDKPAALEQFAVEAVSKVREKFEESKAGSDFLPLRVWETKGFDAKMIEDTTEPHNKKWHPNMGWTYRVPIESLYKGLTVKELRTELLERKAKAKALKQEKPEGKEVGQKEKKRAKHESEEAEGTTSEKEETNNSQSSDDDSSSSSDKKKKKKSKKNKAKKNQKDKKDKRNKRAEKDASEEEKARKKEEAMRKREIELRATKEKKEAHRVATLMLEKTSAVKVQLEEALGSKLIGRVAQFARKDAQDSLKAIVDFHERARACLAQTGPNPSFTAEDVKATAASAKRRCMFLMDLLRSTAKHLEA